MSCSDCNTKCRHCNISYKGRFTADDLFKIASNLMHSGYNISINGTESLMYKEYLKIYKLIGQDNALTNGLVFENNYDYLDEIKLYGISVLNVSYHFDLHSKISTVPKDFLMKLWKEILYRDMRFTINCTISSKNMYKIQQYCEEALSFGAYRIRFTNLLNQGAARCLDRELMLSNSQIDYVINSIDSARSSFLKKDLYIERCGGFGPNPKTKKFYCPAGTDRVFLTPDRKVYPCVF